MWQLVLVFLEIGLASYGGGWTIVGIIKNEILGHGWMNNEGFSRLIAIAQITPGPVALNSATLVGYNLHGFVGSALATIAVVTAPAILSIAVGSAMSKLSKHTVDITEALKTGTIALVIMTVWSFGSFAISSYVNIVFSIVAFIVSAFTKINPLWVILGSGVAGLILSCF